jgi:hypothetical protein
MSHRSEIIAHAHTRPARLWRAIALALVAASLMLCGCDGDSGGSAQTPPDTAGTLTQPDTSDTSSGEDATEEDATEDADASSVGVEARMAFGEGRAEFWGAPFPDEARRLADGRPDMAGYPNPTSNPMVGALLDIVSADVDGFGVSSAVYFPLSGDIDPATLPQSLAQSVAPGASVALFGVDEGIDGAGALPRYPVTVMYEADGGPYGGDHVLSLLPLQGVPLREGGLYAAALMDDIKDAQGQPLRASAAMEALRRGERPQGLGDGAWRAYERALDALRASQDIDLSRVVAMTVFRAGTPTAGLRRAWAQVQAAPAPALPAPSAWAAAEVFDTFCVFEASLEMPTFQEGEPPFQGAGGAWRWDANGTLIQQGSERARVVVTIPREPMPAGGFPLSVMIRTGGGGDRPLVDRGVRATAGGDAPPGTGPAMNFAAAHIAGLSVDGPHGGLRNVTHGDEQFLIFNIQNPVAMRDNIRQSALELALLGDLIPQLRVDAASCPGFSAVDGVAAFDPDRVALMGHSMGATIAPLVLALQPRFRAAVLSGAGGSWIANILYKKLPLEVAPLAKLILGYRSRALHAHDPALTLLQWAGEAADPPVYARYVIEAPWEGAPRHVLMFQGIADTYILPPIANPLTLSLGLDVARPTLDADHPVSGLYPSIASQLPFSGGQLIDLPASLNLQQQTTTGVLAQHLQDPIEDGHEVMFQTPGPKHQYRCFLQAALGLPPSAVVVPTPGQERDACP